MRYPSRLVLSLAAAALSLGLAIAPTAFAQGMKDDGTNKPADAMKKDTMAKPDTMSDPMKKDTMAKPDAMGKPDTMGKPDAMSKDTMKK
ncbi:MAG: pentapeptide MXKDX repeat protein [Xanthobacteraceae bacterium]